MFHNKSYIKNMYNDYLLWFLKYYELCRDYIHVYLLLMTD